MKLEDRISYDPVEYITTLEALLDNLKPFRFESKYRDLLGDLFVQKLSDWDREIRKRKEDPFTIVVCGDFKRGKSSFINALLGEDVVTTNVTTETVTLNKISYGLHSNEAILTGGKRIILSDEELLRDNLEQIIEQAPAPIQQLHIKRPIELLKDITIIDTPGMGDALKDFDSVVEEAMRQADAVIYLFSVNYPISQREQLFLKSVVLPQRHTSLYIVGNYADILRNEKELERMQQLSNERIANLLPDQPVYLLSALDERCRQIDNSCANARTTEQLHENFTALQTALHTMIRSKKDYILPERMNRMLRLMFDDLQSVLNSLEKGLEISSNDLQSAIDHVVEEEAAQSKQLDNANKRIDELFTQMKTQGQQWMTSVFDRLERDIDTLRNIPREDITKFYPFFCIDTVQETVNRCMDYHLQQLLDEMEEISSDLTRNLSKNTQSRSFGFQFTLDSKTWTKGDNIGFFANNLGGIIGLAGSFLAGAMREKEMKDSLPDLVRMIREQYPQFRASAYDTINKNYDQLALNAKRELQDYYAGKIAFAREQVQQTAAVARQSQEKKAEIEATIRNVRLLLERLENI